MKTTLILFLLTFFYFVKGYSQEYHFSQYSTTPLLINPANTGNYKGSVRVSSNYRSQWQGIGEPFQTGTISTDFSILKRISVNENKVALGLVGFFDKSSGGLLKTNSFAASLAYHLFLDKSKSNKLSIGFQTGISNKYLDFQNITFANQFTSNGFDLSIPSNQIFTGSQKSYLDISTGLNFSHIQDEFSYFFGFAFYHLNEPKFSFLGDEKNSIPLRTNVNLGGETLIGQNGKLQGSALFSLVGPATDVLVGLTYAHEMSNNFHDIELRFGTSFRINESFIPYIGYTYDQLQIGISYDIVNPYLVNYNAANRSLELSLVFQLADKESIRKLIPWY